MFNFFRRHKVKILKNKEQKTYQKELKRRSNDIKQAVDTCGTNLKVFGDVDLLSPEKIKIGHDYFSQLRIFTSGSC